MNFYTQLDRSYPESGHPPFTLEEEEECVLSVVFQPEDVGLLGTTVEIAYEDPAAGTLVIPLVGRGLPAGEISVELLDTFNPFDLDHDFGYQFPTSPPLTIEIYNDSDHPLEVWGIDHFPNFQLSAPRGCVRTLAAYERCSFEVQFKPSGDPVLPGEYEAEIGIRAHDSDEPVTVVHLRAEVPDQTWMMETLATGQNGVDMAVDESGRVHLCYYSDYEVTYATSRPWLERGAWETTTVESFSGAQEVQNCAIAVDVGGEVHIAYMVVDPDLGGGGAGTVFAQYSFAGGSPRTVWDRDVRSTDFDMALTTDSDQRPHLVIVDTETAYYVSGNNWSNPGASVWNETYNWASIIDIKHLGIDATGKIIAILGVYGPNELISVGSDMYLNPNRVPAWDWTDFEVNIEPSTNSVIVDLQPTGELTAAGTVDNYLQLRKHQLEVEDDGGNPALDLLPMSEVDSGFFNNQGLEYTGAKPQAVRTDQNGDVHVLFSDSGSMVYVEYLAAGVPYECSDLDDDGPTTVQITEEVGPSGSDGKIGFYSTYPPFVTYMSGSSVKTGRRIVPSVPTLTVSPRRWAEGKETLSRPIFMTNTAFGGGTALLFIDSVDIVMDPRDEGTWELLRCEDSLGVLGGGQTAAVCFMLSDAAYVAQAQLEIGFHSDSNPDGEVVSAELVATQIGLPWRRIEGRRIPGSTPP